MKAILDASGRPMFAAKSEAILHLKNQLLESRRAMTQIKARFDAASTFTGNERHWSNADNFDPHSAASSNVRRILRSRSRYEVLENNPYLKGVVLTLANDFVGSGPKLQIVDSRINKERRPKIEQAWAKWSREIRLRQKIWRSRIAKIVDGEAFLLAYTNKNLRTPVQLDFQVIEADRIGDQNPTPGPQRYNEVDGVRFDNHDNIVEYFLQERHPGGSPQAYPRSNIPLGRWVNKKYMVHWFRQDRGWVRGIPETTPSLPLCALLRRYTLAMVTHAETAANLTAIMYSDAPPGVEINRDPETGDIIEDDPFDTFPIERGMIMNLPYNYKFDQLSAVPPGQSYDEFVGAILREITRPLLMTFNMAEGTSKDSNMASGIVDANIYRSGQLSERYHCEESLLDPTFDLFWEEAVLMPELGVRGDFQGTPDHEWRWDRVGLDHTDPSKVAQALQTLHTNKFITDRDIQETYYNRSVEDWQQEVLNDDKFRNQFGESPDDSTTSRNGKNGKKPTPGRKQPQPTSRRQSSSTRKRQPTGAR